MRFAIIRIGPDIAARGSSLRVMNSPRRIDKGNAERNLQGGALGGSLG